jgi:GTPase
MENQIPIRIAFLGNVDSGKSTLMGVLSKNTLDDGKGTIRKNVFRHLHEQETGRTSSISTNYCKIDNKPILFTDLCGHEKYLKTTLFGLNLVKPDYCFIIVGANMGVSKMTREHILVASALGHKIIICITKIDICPDHILKKTMSDIKTIIRKIQRKSFEIISNDINADIINKVVAIVPLIKISNVSGFNIDVLKNLISKMITNKTYPIQKPTEFIIDRRYNIKGVGLVLAGMLNKGSIKIGENLFINTKDGLKEVIIKSIFDEEDTNVNKIDAGHYCTLNVRVKDCKKIKLKDGMMMVQQNNSIFKREFLAMVYIFNHSTSIKANSEKHAGYQPIIHCNGIRQSAEIMKINGNHKVLRSGQKTTVHFRFRYHNEYILPNSKFIFREGETRGIGKIIKVM